MERENEAHAKSIEDVERAELEDGSGNDNLQYGR